MGLIWSMKRKIFCWFLFALIVFGAGLSSAEETPLTDIKVLLITEELLPTSWSTQAAQVTGELGDLQLSQRISSPQSSVGISYFIYVDPERAIFDGSNNFPFDFETKDIEVPLETGTVVSAKLQKIKKDDPNVQNDEAKMIRMFAHYEGFTFMAYSDSWVLLESAGDPEGILKDILKAGLDTASNLDLEEIDTTARATPTPSTPPPSTSKSPSATLIAIVVLLVAIPVIWFVLKKKE